MAQIAGQEITIHSQNIISCLKFLMALPDFWHNQTYKQSCIDNENEQQVYNEMHASK